MRQKKGVEGPEGKSLGRIQGPGTRNEDVIGWYRPVLLLWTPSVPLLVELCMVRTLLELVLLDPTAGHRMWLANGSIDLVCLLGSALPYRPCRSGSRLGGLLKNSSSRSHSSMGRRRISLSGAGSGSSQDSLLNPLSPQSVTYFDFEKKESKGVVSSL